MDFIEELNNDVIYEIPIESITSSNPYLPLITHNEMKLKMYVINKDKICPRNSYPYLKKIHLAIQSPHLINFKTSSAISLAASGLAN